MTKERQEALFLVETIGSTEAAFQKYTTLQLFWIQ